MVEVDTVWPGAISAVEFTLEAVVQLADQCGSWNSAANGPERKSRICVDVMLATCGELVEKLK